MASTFRLKGTFTAVLTICLVVPLAAHAQTVTLSPTQDSWIVEGSPTSNHGSDNVLSVHSATGATRRRAVIQFDLSSIPVCASISSAVLKLTLNNAPAASRVDGAHVLTKTWTELGVTWNTTNGTTAWTSPGGDFGAATATANTGTTNSAVIQWTVTSDVAGFVATPSTNRGWLIKDENETADGSSLAYSSQQNATVAERPVLVVTYTTSGATCDDSNVCTTDTCTVSGCQHTNNSLPCNDSLFCNGTDTCGGGTCSIHSGNPCPGPDGDSNCSESCNEALDNCTAADPNGTSCRPAVGPCDNAETCSGGVCPPDTFKTSGVCRPSAGACDLADSCNGSGPNCPADAKSTAVCRGAAGVCDLAESCDGVNNTCPPDVKSTAPCRPAAGVCDVAEVCNGVSNTCPADAFQPASTVCRQGTPGEVCDQTEFCTGTGANCPADAVKPASTICRNSAGVCDLAEHCDGTTKFCPADAKSTAVCRLATDACDATESCDGVNDDCPPDALKPATAVCRAASPGELCDQSEFCTGSDPACPPDDVKPNGTVCRAAAGVCDLAEQCDGVSKLCPTDAKSTAQCRASAGSCDVAENCNGVSNNCPANAFLPSSTVCRPATMGALCDAAESCPGTGPNCPPDGVKPNGTTCRAAAGPCDNAETCNGSSPNCPADAFKPNTTPCRAAAGVCDAVENCTGGGPACPPDVKQPNTTPCRAAANSCDVAENCDGSSDNCPADAKQPNGTSCSDGVFCNGGETCQSGTCTAGSPPCPPLVVCDEPSDMCLPNACLPSPIGSCRTAEKSLLLIKDNASDDSKDKLIWKFIKGQSTTFAEMSDPRTIADYTLCIYAGAGPSLVGTVNILPSSTLWSVLGTDKGYKYKDDAGMSDGVKRGLLKDSGSNKTKALVKGGGATLPDGILGPTGLQMPVTAQLLNHQTGICFQGTYTTPKKNTSVQFKAKQ